MCLGRAVQRYKEMGGDVIREVKVVKGRQDLVLSESAQGVSETGAI